LLYKQYITIVPQVVAQLEEQKVPQHVAQNIEFVPQSVGQLIEVLFCNCDVAWLRVDMKAVMSESLYLTMCELD
jgi:hypothetical protein